MTIGLLADLILLPALLALGTAIVLARAPFTAVALFIAHGLLLAIAWARLGLLDVALTEAAIGAGLSGVLLLGAARRLRGAGVVAEARPGRTTRLLIGAGCVLLSAALAAAVLLLPGEAPSLATEVAARLEATALGNPVGGVLMGFRALDTLLEAAVVALAVTCVWALAPDDAWGGRPGAAQPLAEHGPLVLLARLLPPLGVVVAAHILWVGADAPGGKFQAAAILAAMWLMPWMAGIVRPPPLSSGTLRTAVATGPLLFLAAGLGGLLLEGAFLAYPSAWTKPIILLVEVALAGSIAAALALLVLGPPEAGGRR
jgi:multisubunit Na+/H+ antiporter MnhB subunit